LLMILCAYLRAKLSHASGTLPSDLVVSGAAREGVSDCDCE
jgi:hypothetical protein